MPLYSGPLFDSQQLQDAGTDEIGASTGQVLGANADAGWHDGLTNRSLRWIEREAEPDTSPHLSVDEANSKYPGMKFTRPLTDAVASDLAADQHRRDLDDDIIQRGRGGAIETVAGFGARALPQVLDPINVAATVAVGAATDGLGLPALWGSTIARGGGAAVAARLGKAAIEGELAQVPLTAADSALDHSEQHDMTMGELANQLFLGAATGAALHGIGIAGRSGASRLRGRSAAGDLDTVSNDSGVGTGTDAASTDMPMSPVEAASQASESPEAVEPPDAVGNLSPTLDNPMLHRSLSQEAVSSFVEDRPSMIADGLGIAHSGRSDDPSDMAQAQARFSESKARAVDLDDHDTALSRSEMESHAADAPSFDGDVEAQIANLHRQADELEHEHAEQYGAETTTAKDAVMPDRGDSLGRAFVAAAGCLMRAEG